VVALDGGADEVFSYGNVRPEQVKDLVHGAIFTRHPRDLKDTALFIGGSDVAAAELLLAEALRHMIPSFGLRVSILFDANGCNTTAAAAVRSAARHLELMEARALVIGTGPVGQRISWLLAGLGAEVGLGSRSLGKAAALCEKLRSKIPAGNLIPMAVSNPDELKTALAGRTLVFAAGASGVQVLPQSIRSTCPELRVAIDLNAVPPLGIEGIEVNDRGAQRDGTIGYGAVGVGETKMKVHKAAIAQLFQRNDQVLDIEQLYSLGQTF
jgi:threonine dehydrogenase-like Zn-dependent dehydrogenase